MQNLDTRRRDIVMRFLEERSREHFTELVTETSERVHAAAMRVLCDRSLAEEVTQETYVKLYTTNRIRREGLRSGVAVLVSLATSIARTTLRSESRRRERERRAGEGRASELSAKLGDVRLDTAALVDLRDAIVDLPEDCRSCVELRYFCDMKLEPIAGELGVSIATIHERLKRACQLLERRLSPLALAFLVPLLSGKAEATWTGLAPTTELAARLSGIGEAETTLTMASTASLPRASASSGTFAALLLATGCLGIMMSVAIMIFSPEEEREGVAAVVDGVTARAGGGRGVFAGAARREAAVGGARASGDAITPEASNAFVVRVIDEDGQLLREGRVHIDVPDSVIENARREGYPAIEANLQGLEEGFSLADSNPVTIDWMPEELEGAEVVFMAHARGFSHAEPVPLRVEIGKGARVELVLGAGRSLDVDVVNSRTGAPIPGAFVEAFPVSRSQYTEASCGAFTAQSSSFDVGVENRGLIVLENASSLEDAWETDEAGHVTIEGLAVGEQRLRVTVPGYIRRSVRVFVASEGDVAPARIAMAPTAETSPATLTVRVIDREGLLAEGVPIECVVLALETGAHRVEGRTDAEGRIVFEDLPIGLADVGLPFMSWFGGRELADKNLRLGIGKTWIDLESGAAHELTLGRVDGNASVTINMTWRGADDLRASAFLMGESSRAEDLVEERAEFTGVDPGEYDVSVKFANDSGGTYWEMGERIVVGDGEHVEHTLPMLGASVRGTLRACDGGALEDRAGFEDVFALEDVPIIIESLDEGMPRRKGETATRRDGTFELLGLAPGRYRVSSPGTRDFRHIVPRTIFVAGMAEIEDLELLTMPGGRVRIFFDRAELEALVERPSELAVDESDARDGSDAPPAEPIDLESEVSVGLILPDGRKVKFGRELGRVKELAFESDTLVPGTYVVTIEIRDRFSTARPIEVTAGEIIWERISLPGAGAPAPERR